MKRRFIVIAIVLCTLCVILASCGRNANPNSGNATYLGPRNTADGTISANLINSIYPQGITLNWADSADRTPDFTASGLQQIVFVLNGNETMKDWWNEKELSSIKLTFTGQTSGKSQTLSTSLVGIATNLITDGEYFELDGNTFKFYPHYFSEGEVVNVVAEFDYRGPGLLGKLESKVYTGTFSFTVGQSTGEKFSGFLDGIGDTISGIGNGKNDGSQQTGILADGTITENSYSPIKFRIDGLNGDYTVYRLKDDAEKNVIYLTTKTPTITFLTREPEAGTNITKVYVIPWGMEDTMDKIAWTNESYLADNSHIFQNLDLSAYSGSIVTLRVEFLDGAELDPFKEHTFGVISFYVP